MRKIKFLPLLILFIFLASACQSNWSIALTENGTTAGTITRDDVNFTMRLFRKNMRKSFWTNSSTITAIA
jgi:ABC-type Fe3+-hydroxamate transport system substrate-binding protein